MAFPAVCSSPIASATAVVPAPVLTPTLATIVPTLSPARLGARAALTFAIHFAGGPGGVPLPLRRSTLRFPAGLRLDVPRLRGCSAGLLLAHGPGDCPAQSRIGGGHAYVETRAGSQKVSESVVLGAFLGGLQNDGLPSVEVIGQGQTPLQRRMVFAGAVHADRPPYGEALSVSLPPIHTLPLEPDAALLSFTLTIGVARPTSTSNTVVVPSSWPPGGFPFAAAFTYADGSRGSASTTIPCPA